VAANLIIAVPFSQYYIWNTRCFFIRTCSIIDV